MTVNLGGSATPTMINVGIWALAIAVIVALAIWLISQESLARKLFGALVAVIAGFLAIGEATIFWRAPFALLAFGVSAAGFVLTAVQRKRTKPGKKDITEF